MCVLLVDTVCPLCVCPLCVCVCVCLRSKHHSQGERKLRRLRASHVKSLRQLSGKAEKVTNRRHGRNIIQSYTNFDSEVPEVSHTNCTCIYLQYTTEAEYIVDVQTHGSNPSQALLS